MKQKKQVSRTVILTLIGLALGMSLAMKSQASKGGNTPVAVVSGVNITFTAGSPSDYTVSLAPNAYFQLAGSGTQYDFNEIGGFYIASSPPITNEANSAGTPIPMGFTQNTLSGGSFSGAEGYNLQAAFGKNKSESIQPGGSLGFYFSGTATSPTYLLDVYTTSPYFPKADGTSSGGNTGIISFTPDALVTPEPSSMVSFGLAGLGLLGLMVRTRRTRRAGHPASRNSLPC